MSAGELGVCIQWRTGCNIVSCHGARFYSMEKMMLLHIVVTTMNCDTDNPFM